MNQSILDMMTHNDPRRYPGLEAIALAPGLELVTRCGWGCNLVNWTQSQI